MSDSRSQSGEYDQLLMLRVTAHHGLVILHGWTHSGPVPIHSNRTFDKPLHGSQDFSPTRGCRFIPEVVPVVSRAGRHAAVSFRRQPDRMVNDFGRQVVVDLHIDHITTGSIVGDSGKPRIGSGSCAEDDLLGRQIQSRDFHSGFCQPDGFRQVEIVFVPLSPST